MARQGELLGYIVFSRNADQGGVIRARDRLSSALSKAGKPVTFGVDLPNRRLEVRGKIDSSIIDSNLKSIAPNLHPKFVPYTDVGEKLSKSLPEPKETHPNGGVYSSPSSASPKEIQTANSATSGGPSFTKLVQDKRELEVMYTGVLRQKDDLEKERSLLRENIGELEKRIKSLLGEGGVLEAVANKYGGDVFKLFKAIVVLQTPLQENETYQALKPQYDKALKAKQEAEREQFLSVSPKALEIISRMDALAREYNDATVLVSSYLNSTLKTSESLTLGRKKERKKRGDSVASKVLHYAHGKNADELFHLIYPDAKTFDSDEKRSKKQQVYTTISKLKSDGKLFARSNPDGRGAIYDAKQSPSR